jgi:hypothetical protein
MKLKGIFLVHLIHTAALFMLRMEWKYCRINNQVPSWVSTAGVASVVVAPLMVLNQVYPPRRWLSLNILIIGLIH